ncbi:MAG: hypothetical protein ABI823_21105 [Bryobacteraceae bacterium]
MTSGKSIASSLAAVGSVLAASSCCLPLGTLWLAAGAAGAGAFLDQYRPWLMAASLLLVGYGFFEARRAARCGRNQGWLSRGLLWFSLLFVGVSLLFPQLFATLLAG